jgi:hypothetical protein
MQLINRTPFPGAVFIDTDRHGAEMLVLTMKATYELEGSDEPSLAEPQNKLVFSDVYFAEPGTSSLLYESDTNWGRQETDIALVGYAYPKRPGDRETEVMLSVGGLIKTARVFGDRKWHSLLGMTRMSTPEPFERIPLIYEYAFGGTDHSLEQPGDLEGERRNPVGRGLQSKRSGNPGDLIMLPNIEDPGNLIRWFGDRPAPVGFTFVAKSWKPRCNFAGTYDAAWQAHRMPLLPKDFDPKFYTAASEGLSAPFLSGGELVNLLNLTPKRRERFVLPRVDIHAAFLVDMAPTPITMRLDAVIIDAMNMKLVIVWHGSSPVQGLVDDVRWVLVEGGFV